MSEQALVPPTCENTVSDEVLAISHTMTRMRLMIGRRVIGRMAIAKLAPGWICRISTCWISFTAQKQQPPSVRLQTPCVSTRHAEAVWWRKWWPEAC